MTNKLPVAVSLVVPAHNEPKNVRLLVDRTIVVMDSLLIPWELIFVNDGSEDDTLEIMLQLREQDKRIRVIDLSRNFGKEAALTAGLDHARGDCAIPLDADLQDPPEIIPLLIAKWRDGYDVVNAVRIARTEESWLKRLTAHLFYRVINRLSRVAIPPDTGDFRLLSRPALDALRRLPERRRFMKGLFAWVGFRVAEIPYSRPARTQGKTHFAFWYLWNFALDGVTSFSEVPLKVASYLGFLVSLVALIYAVYIGIETLIYGNPVKGVSIPYGGHPFLWRYPAYGPWSYWGILGAYLRRNKGTTDLSDTEYF